MFETAESARRTGSARSSVEEAELLRTGKRLVAGPMEHIGVIEVDSFPLLGKLTALRFLEWVAKNPGGVISLPTGKSPEFFIKWTRNILERWDEREIQELLDRSGVPRNRKPDMRSLTFVQIDEFYPMDASHHNSFHYYVSEFYLRGFGLDPSKALLIDATRLGLPPGKSMEEVFPGGAVDLTLRVRQTTSDLERLQKEVINRVDVFCMEYERKIRDLGGIGFFLGGIGPDGHLAFNVRGSSFYSVTRLTGTNYETQAAAAGDLGGIEISRNRLVITIGLATITFNPSATAILLAAGEAKAHLIRRVVEEQPHPQVPASVLQSLPNARCYLTRGAAALLTGRRFEEFQQRPDVPAEAADDICIRLSLKHGRSLLDLSSDDFASDLFGAELLKKTSLPHEELARNAFNRIVAKIEKGLTPVGSCAFLHTEPHQDDVMLGYLAYIYHLVRDPSNRHYFANLTSGFTSVSNSYFLSILEKLERHIHRPEFGEMLRSGYFESGDPRHRMEDVYLFLDGTAARKREWKDEAEARRLLRNLIEVTGTKDKKALILACAKIHGYLAGQYPGAKDPAEVQTLKGMQREWEVELLWAYFGIESSDVHALRLGFYRGDIFPEEPEFARDVKPIHDLISRIKPDVISVAFDPEASGPDTHYKALQAVAAAVRLHEEATASHGIRVWGYRNVWYRFRPAEADIMVPVSLNTLSLLQTAFMNCFGSQSAASFPSYEHDGPFSELAQQIQVEQYETVKTCLRKDFFLRHPHPRLRAARGMIFLKEMSLPQFYARVRELKKVNEETA